VCVCMFVRVLGACITAAAYVPTYACVFDIATSYVRVHGRSWVCARSCARVIACVCVCMCLLMQYNTIFDCTRIVRYALMQWY
jgi:hypothetical protein